MKVRIALTVEVDEEAWALNYGTDGAADTRRDVLAYVSATLADCPVPILPAR